jgi:hypothetical protein
LLLQVLIGNGVLEINREQFALDQTVFLIKWGGDGRGKKISIDNRES